MSILPTPPSSLPLTPSPSHSHTHIDSHSRPPSPLPAYIAKPVRKLSNAAFSAISAGASAFHTLSSQVGGHPGVLASEDNLLIVKACLRGEKGFYELLASLPPGGGVSGGRGLEKLKKWTPRFYGTLRLEGRIKAIEEGLEVTGGAGVMDLGQGIPAIEPVPDVEEKDKSFSPPLRLKLCSIVLENVSSVFTKPNIMDIKLGTVLYEDSDTPEKKERMLETARNTTSLETGVRLTGFQVYDHTAGEPVITPKTYGKSIKASDLPDGMRRFFPLSPSPSSSTSSTTSPSTAKPSGQGLPRTLLLPIMHGLLNDIRAIRETLSETELRMVGGSLLIVYEADWDAARVALENTKARVNESEVTNSAGVEAVEEDGLGYDSDAESEEEEEAPAYAVRLIDFAHTHLTPGQGPDLGVLKGIDMTISLLEGRIKEVEATL